jgi:hypothetical protein
MYDIEYDIVRLTYDVVRGMYDIVRKRTMSYLARIQMSYDGICQVVTGRIPGPDEPAQAIGSAESAEWATVMVTVPAA